MCIFCAVRFVWVLKMYVEAKKKKKIQWNIHLYKSKVLYRVHMRNMCNSHPFCHYFPTCYDTYHKYIKTSLSLPYCDFSCYFWWMNFRIAWFFRWMKISYWMMPIQPATMGCLHLFFIHPMFLFMLWYPSRIMY